MGHLLRRALPIVFLLACATRVSGATSDQVEQALAKAKKYVYSQHKHGNWEKSVKPEEKSDDKLVNSQWGGQTAIAAYALLASGENPNTEPRLAEAIDFLKKARLGGTYGNLRGKDYAWCLRQLDSGRLSTEFVSMV